MKLILAIVNNDDSAVVSATLTRENYSVTKLSTTGGFLMIGNTTLLIGAEDDKVARAKEIIREYSMTRSKVTMTTDSLGRGLQKNSLEEEVTVGGATVFVLDVESMDKYEGRKNEKNNKYIACRFGFVFILYNGKCRKRKYRPSFR